MGIIEMIMNLFFGGKKKEEVKKLDKAIKVKNEEVKDLEKKVEKLEKKNLVMYIYVGKPSSQYKAKYGDEARIQLNDNFSEVSDVAAFIQAERASKREEEIPYLTTSLRVDREANMGVVMDIKQELRKVNALKLNYTTTQGDISNNQ